MDIQHWLNDSDRRNQGTWRKTYPRATLVHYKSHMDWPRIKPRPLWKYYITACTQNWPAKENRCQTHLDSNPDFNERVMFGACFLFSDDHVQDACYWSLTNPLGCTNATILMIQRWWCGVVCLVTWLWIHASSKGMWTKRYTGGQSAYPHYFKNGTYFLICQVTSSS